VYENHAALLFSSYSKEFVFDSETNRQGYQKFGVSQLENEIGILQSYTLVRQALQKLNFEVSYFHEENLIPKLTYNKSPFILFNEIYRMCPFTVLFDRENPQPLYLRFYIEILPDNKFRIKANENNIHLYSYITHTELGIVDNININGIYEFGEKIETDNFSFTIMLNENFGTKKYHSKKIFFYFNNTNYQTLKFLSKLDIDQSSDNSTLVNITISGENSEKITEFLNTFTKVYLDRNLERKNRMAVNTVNFIERQIKDISDSLSYTEEKLQHYRTTHKVMDLSFQGEKIYDKLLELENQKAEFLVQAKYYSYIKKYLNSNENVLDLAAPSSMGVEDKVLSELISQLILKNAERINLLNNSNNRSIFLGGLEREIQNLKKTILENVSYNQSTTQISINEIENRAIKLTEQIEQLPQTERELFGIKRKFNLTDAIYTFMLQKRAEAQISKAAHTADCEIIDPARLISISHISPKRKMNYIIAIILGLAIPFIFILIRDFLNDKISNRRDIERISQFPIIGQVLHNDKKDKLILANYPNSLIAESFRAVRTYIQLLFEQNEQQIILTTSSLYKEGRKLVAVNIATAFTFYGKKSILVSFDMRDSTLHQILDMDNEIGLSSYLSNKATLEDIIQKTSIENLDFISSGDINVNAIELISSGKTISLINKLKEMYDHIIIDTSPVGLVTDTYLLMKYADVNIVVVRNAYTRKSVFSSILQNLKTNKIPNVAILLNDVKPSRNPFDYGHELSYMNQLNSKKKVKDFFFQKD
ncbi:MAG: polysaccharide biosynthesis tyrosine autokinase, partial [Bacteroidota bacterium]|nr:polysaccharide biosynthesis tyrosine autokinase [Bacteroidota bacterium]